MKRLYAVAPLASKDLNNQRGKVAGRGGIPKLKFIIENIKPL